MQRLNEFGQSPWLDDLGRGLINRGKLDALIKDDGLRGATSNPSIFDKAISDSTDYDEAIAGLAKEGKDPQQIYEVLTTQDVRTAADHFRPIFDELEGGDGFVSLEVNPHLAYDAAGSIAEAKRLWGELARPNVFIKIPATEPGLEAIRELTSEGINVNVTLLFGLPRYREVIEAYLLGLEQRLEKGGPIARIASVASFFLSRIDVLVDPQLEEMMSDSAVAKKLHGQVAIASAKEAYQIYLEAFGSDRFKALAAKGARPQRLLWASTGTKNPDYSDVKYVEPLIGKNTINTLTLETIKAYRDHGQPEADTIEQGVDEAKEVLRRLGEAGISIDEVTAQLEKEAVEKFNKPYDSLQETLKTATQKALA
jgi:transaldolase